MIPPRGAEPLTDSTWTDYGAQTPLRLQLSLRSDSVSDTTQTVSDATINSSQSMPLSLPQTLPQKLSQTLYQTLPQTLSQTLSQTASDSVSDAPAESVVTSRHIVSRSQQEAFCEHNELPLFRHRCLPIELLENTLKVQRLPLVENPPCSDRGLSATFRLSVSPASEFESIQFHWISGFGSISRLSVSVAVVLAVSPLSGSPRRVLADRRLSISITVYLWCPVPVTGSVLAATVGAPRPPAAPLAVTCRYPGQAAYPNVM